MLFLIKFVVNYGTMVMLLTLEYMIFDLILLFKLIEGNHSLLRREKRNTRSVADAGQIQETFRNDSDIVQNCSKGWKCVSIGRANF